VTFIIYCEIWSSHGGEDVDVGLGGDAVDFQVGTNVSEEHTVSIFKASWLISQHFNNRIV
jgi:hypothetical protein